MKLELKKIITGISYNVIQGNLDIDIDNVEFDSRLVKDNGLFLCIDGAVLDGHTYIPQAIEKGAIALIVEKEVNDIPDNITVIRVKKSMDIMSELAINFYQNPSQDIPLIGVTGTNGKTTTANLMAKIFEYYGKKVGVLGTLENRIGDKRYTSTLTTPQSLDLQKLFTEMKKEHVDYIAMEVSSHALAMNRVNGCKYDVGVFTNLSLDHLDYHKNMEEYLLAKARLFTLCKYGVINIDDEASKKIIDVATCEIVTYAIDKEADFRASDITMDDMGISYSLHYDGKEYSVKFGVPGRFNVYNTLACIATCVQLGIPINTCLESLASMGFVKGRFEPIVTDRGFTAIVDYAHTPDGLENVLATIKEYVKGKAITVFGCGGDRDNSKRSVMGKVAGNYSDYCVVTSDNPRTENPESILDQIEVGIVETGCKYIKMVDRKEAIEHAIDVAKEDDVILIAGKGHENYQILGHEKIHFDDAEIVKEYLGEKK